MKMYYITFRSVTFAQQGERIIKRAGMDCMLRRTPKGLSQRGCGYSLQLREPHALPAIMLLKENAVRFEGIFLVSENGAIEELKS